MAIKKIIHIEENIRTIQKHSASRSIILVGMMGCGKSTMAKKLATILQKPLYDSDKEIEKFSALSITKIFEIYGEGHFRQLEQNIFQKLLAKKDGAIIASGGGAFAQDPIREQILREHIAIWLKTNVHCLVQRIRLNKNRPLLQKDNPEQILSALLKQRYPFYEQAPLHFENNLRKSPRTVHALLDMLARYLKS